jgi:hypothetical protein
MGEIIEIYYIPNEATRIRVGNKKILELDWLSLVL